MLIVLLQLFFLADVDDDVAIVVDGGVTLDDNVSPV